MTKISCASRFGRYVDVLDVATGEKLMRVEWANDETGEYCQWVDGVRRVCKGKIKVTFDGPAHLYEQFVKEHGA